MCRSGVAVAVVLMCQGGGSGSVGTWECGMLHVGMDFSHYLAVASPLPAVQILIFAEALGLYGLIVALIMSQKGDYTCQKPK